MRGVHLLVILSVVAFLPVRILVAEDEFKDLKAIEKIELLGGIVTRDGYFTGNPELGVDFHTNQRISDRFMHVLRPFTGLTELNYKLKTLKTVLLNETAITNPGVKELKEALPGLSVDR